MGDVKESQGVVSVGRRRFIGLLHWLVVFFSGVLLYTITYDILNSISFIADEHYMRIQFWICIFFIAETVLEWLLASDRRKRLPISVLLVIVCIPYISLIHHYGWHVPSDVYYFLRVVPIVRVAAVLIVMWGLMEKNWVTGMFGSYIIILVITLYLLSMMFYVEEHAVNSLVYDYWQSLWYSIMQMNTCGSNISPVTPAGKVIGVVLSVEGLIVFPVFTVFFTRAFGRTRVAKSVG